MKRIFSFLLMLALLFTSAQATIHQPTGIDESFRDFTGIECQPALVLCHSLSVCDERNGKKVTTLYYGDGTDTIPVIEAWDGWAKIYYAEGTKTGWVRSEYLLFDPAWYECDEGTRVYAYDDHLAPCVAYLSKGTKRAIIRETEEWVLISLRGAAGWIYKTADDHAAESWFSPEMLKELASAELLIGQDSHLLVDEARLKELSALLTSATPTRGVACPFTATLLLETQNGRLISLALATDSCCAYRVDGFDYAYARFLKTPDSGVDNTCLFSLFQIDLSDYR